jgi:hypothetical protein
VNLYTLQIKEVDMAKQKSLRDVSAALEKATLAIEEIERRALYVDPPKLSFEQRIIDAVRGLDEGSPLKDYLDEDDIERAIKTLGDVYTITGVQMPADWA